MKALDGKKNLLLLPRTEKGSRKSSEEHYANPPATLRNFCWGFEFGVVAWGQDIVLDDDAARISLQPKSAMASFQSATL